ncbi:hypothetical protein [Ancylomarina sp.]|uniref:hypothetical protein n=1 Tax=Ancylomarina sp. TaxID=1970196 RepID=UPI003566EFE2
MTEATTTTKTIEELVIESTQDKIVSPIIPVDITIGESGTLNRYATEDEEVLLAKGLKEGLIQQLIPSAKFLQDKQSAWIAVYQSALSSTQQWEAKIDEARLLQRELKHDFQFAYRNHPDILKKLKNIVDGNGNMDLIQDMSDYSAFAKQYPEPLAAIFFDTTKADRAKHISLDLTDLINTVDGVKNSKNRPEKLMRDRAYTYLKQLVDEIRAYGKYAFWNDEEKQKRYSSEYLRKGRERNEAKNIEE